MTARRTLSAGPAARGAGGDTFLTRTERRCQREILVVSSGIRYQTRLWLQAVKEAAAWSAGEHDPELIPGCLLLVHACGEVLSSRSPSLAVTAPRALCLSGNTAGAIVWMPEGCRLRM